jgi:predicted nucleotide-binding protein
VVLELGYFAGKLGRKRVCALVKGAIETPSDYDGVIYIDIDDGVGWKLELARELNAAGLTIDMDGLL